MEIKKELISKLTTPYYLSKGLMISCESTNGLFMLVNSCIQNNNKIELGTEIGDFQGLIFQDDCEVSYILTDE
jgi:hypothetical protein